ncbi:MFS transporter [Actinomadura rupiterrae]|uniref:MFS transporter n=1 Tax=Actinomadura rupiterrae TaxID=559627 RepID=UPI0020A44EE7|nr:MFS transporter [Actinomadura rupiterrae]MCP2337110.1 MFS family permease [Actinomadura rupiterrae]
MSSPENQTPEQRQDHIPSQQPPPAVPAASTVLPPDEQAASTDSAEPAGAGATAGADEKTALWRRVAIDTRPLAHPAYRRLWLGQGVSFVGFQVTSVAVPVQVYEMTHSSLWVGVLGIANLVPLIVFGLWGGAVADHMDRRKLLLAASCVSWTATLVLMLQALLHAGSLALILGAVAVQSVGFAVSSPTRGAIIPRLLDEPLVPAANTLNFTVQTVGTLTGPLLAGLILTHWSYPAAYALDAALFAVGLYAAVRLPAIPPLGAGTGPLGLRSVVDGLRFIATQPVLLMSFVVDLIAMVVAMPRALFPEMAETRFHSEAAVGWLVAAIGFGALLGGLLSGWIGRIHRQGAALVASIAVWGVAVAAAGLAHALWLAFALLAVGGAADLVSSVFRQSILQTYAPDEMRGRLQGVFTVVVAGGPRLGDLRAGAVASVAGAGASWVGGGVVCAVLVVIVGLSVPSLMTYAPGASGD